MLIKVCEKWGGGGGGGHQHLVPPASYPPVYAHPLPGSSGSEVTRLRHLHWCLDQLMITWRTKLLRIEGVTAMQTERGGRPPKTINIELVRM